jgi:hypothetical protein
MRRKGARIEERGRGQTGFSAILIGLIPIEKYGVRSQRELFPTAWVSDRKDVDAYRPALGNLRVVIYPNDHRPAHVHIKGAKGEAVFMLHCLDRPLELRGSYGLKRSDLGSIEETLSDVLASLCAQWKEIHGDY